MGNWLADIIKPYEEASNPQHYDEENSLWNRKGKKNKYEQQQTHYNEDPTNTLAPRLAHSASHPSLSHQFLKHRSRDSLCDPRHQLDSNTTQYSSSYRLQRHRSLPSSYVQNQPFINGAVTGTMGLGPTANTMNHHPSSIMQQPYFPQNQPSNALHPQYINHPSSMYNQGQNYHHQRGSQQPLYHHYSKPGYYPQHYHNQPNSVAYRQQQQVLHCQQQHMQQQQQQQQVYALHNNNPIYQMQGGAVDPYYSSTIYHKNRMSM